MTTRKITINQVCKLNAETIGSKNTTKIIHYLDTSSITRNKIENIQVLDSRIAPFPSRAKRKVKEGTIIYSTVRPEQEHYGFIEKRYENLIVSTGFITIDVIDQDIDPKYIYYLLIQKHITDYLQTIAVNNVSSYPSINPDDLGNLKFEIPKEKDEQKKIANVLSALDLKIELNNRINSELEAMAKTLYDYWFVQFDFPDAHGKPYKTSGGKMVWNEELKKEIPEGWKVKKICELAETASGGTPKSTIQRYYENGNIPWVNSGELNSLYIFEVKKFITEEGLKNSSAKMLPENSILVALYGATAGKVSMLKVKACTNQAVCAVLPKNQEYINIIRFTIQDLYNHLVKMSSGSARDNLSQDIIKNIKVIVPNKDSLKQFNNIVNPCIDKIVMNIKENILYAELRDWLLPMLMNGKVKVE